VPLDAAPDELDAPFALALAPLLPRPLLGVQLPGSPIQVLRRKTDAASSAAVVVPECAPMAGASS
jgi:hypothetical protein